MTSKAILADTRENGGHVASSAPAIPATPQDDAHQPEHGHAVGAGELIRIGAVVLIAAAVWFRLWEPFPRVSVIGLVGTVAGGLPIFHETWINIRGRRM